MALLDEEVALEALPEVLEVSRTNLLLKIDKRRGLVLTTSLFFLRVRQVSGERQFRRCLVTSMMLGLLWPQIGDARVVLKWLSSCSDWLPLPLWFSQNQLPVNFQSSQRRQFFEVLPEPFVFRKTIPRGLRLSLFRL